ncbi:hypothetical protein [Kaarinaea lacus]
MATSNIHSFGKFISRSEETKLPQTSKGRALRTTDWFLYGRPADRNYDRATIRSLNTAA